MVSELVVSVAGELPPLKNEALSILSPTHSLASRVRALLEAAQRATSTSNHPDFGARRLGMRLVVRPVGALRGDATNALVGVADVLQKRRRNAPLAHLGDLSAVEFCDDDAQLRDVHCSEESGPPGYEVRLWAL